MSGPQGLLAHQVMACPGAGACALCADSGPRAPAPPQVGGGPERGGGRGGPAAPGAPAARGGRRLLPGRCAPPPGRTRRAPRAAAGAVRARRVQGARPAANARARCLLGRQRGGPAAGVLALAVMGACLQSAARGPQCNLHAERPVRCMQALNEDLKSRHDRERVRISERVRICPRQSRLEHWRQGTHMARPAEPRRRPRWQSSERTGRRR